MRLYFLKNVFLFLKIKTCFTCSRDKINLLLFIFFAGEFWLGLDNIHSLSQQGQYVLQVELSDEAGRQQTARYRFHLDGEEKMFALYLEDESPSEVQEKILTSGASGLPFSTADRDNDLAADINCAELLSGMTASLKKGAVSPHNTKHALIKSPIF